MIMMPNRTKVSQVVNSDSLITFFLILVLLAAFAGLLLTGCGGESGPGLTEVDGGWQCEIPSPTGDQDVVVPPGNKVAPARTRAQYIVIATNVETLCNNYKAWATAQNKKNGVTNDTALSGLDCSDAAHDFEGTSGYYWCVDLVQPSELATLKSSSYCKGLPSDEFSCIESVVENFEYTPPLGSTCQGTGQTADVKLNSPACEAALIVPGAVVNNSMTRDWALCSQTGVFMGWMCGSGQN